MDNATYQRHLALRREAAARILESPREWRVCDHCRAVSRKEVARCPFCGGYCWDEREWYVRETALAIAASAFPYNAGVVPRLEAVRVPPLAPKRKVLPLS